MCTLEIKNNKNTELPFYKHIIQNIFFFQVFNANEYEK